MDATLKDFLNEINEIAPPEKEKEKEKKDECDWQECFDDSSGFPYYWHVSTNEVTWEMPDEYKKWLDGSKKVVAKNNVPVEPTVEPLFPVAVVPAVVASNVYKISDVASKATSRSRVIKNARGKSKPPRMRSSDSEDEKIVLISSYGGDTESENEDNEADKLPQVESKPNSNTSSPKPVSKPASDEDEHETVINQKPAPDLIKTTSGYSLIAGYGEDSDEEEEDEVVEEKKVETGHSTLFPITKPIDVAQFAEPKPSLLLEPDEDIDAKAFQRKRRIGVHLVNVPRRVKDDTPVDEDKKGFGYKADGASYKSTTMTFIKADTLYPAEVPERVVANGDVCKEIEDAHVTLVEKLRFLSEGKEPVSPVQIMLIQLETLYSALKSGQLNAVYLNKWITDTNGELIKLEEDVAPSGWLLQWDRSQKRYYYKNAATDECQWDYPEAAEDDAMDICTTPPPPEVIQETRTPTPPPPSPCLKEKEERHLGLLKDDMMLLPVIAEGQPLPPGVDIEEPCETVKEKPPKDLILALDSFYSDIAAMESSVVSPVDPILLEQKDPTLLFIESSEPARKKKKVKMSTGISMKKKGVSKLVEKWKSVQKDLE